MLTRNLHSITRHLYLWACRRLYNEFAWSYDMVSWAVSAGHWGAWRRAVLDPLPFGRVLEVGFGTGELLIELERRGRQVYGLELSPAMQHITTRKLQARGLAARIVRTRGKAQALPFPDGYFDAVVATFPAEYIFDPVSTCEFARVLRPAGDGDNGSPGRLVIGGVAVWFENPRLARLAPILYGAPPQGFLRRWQETLAGAGLRPQIISPSCDGARVLTIIADRVS